MALPQDRPVHGGRELNGFPDWAWIAFTLAAASLQAFRTAAQKWLGGRLTTDAATYVRYLFAWPVAAIAALILAAAGTDLPAPTLESLGWAALAGAGQIGGTRFLLKALESRNFAVGVAYSKTDVIQAAIFEAVVMGAAVTLGAAAGMVIATAGVMLISIRPSERGWTAFARGLGEPSALYGLLSGASFAVSGVAVRAGVLSLEAGGMAGGGLAGAAIVALISMLTLQVVLMGAYLMWREPGTFAAIGRVWPASSLAGVTGGLGSICWFLALGLQQVAYVRTLGLVEILATIALSRFLFGERPRWRELTGIAVLLAGIALVLNSG